MLSTNMQTLNEDIFIVSAKESTNLMFEPQKFRCFSHDCLQRQ